MGKNLIYDATPETCVHEIQYFIAFDQDDDMGVLYVRDSDTMGFVGQRRNGTIAPYLDLDDFYEEVIACEELTPEEPMEENIYHFCQYNNLDFAAGGTFEQRVRIKITLEVED